MERRSVFPRGVVAALASQLILVACGGGGGDDGGITNPPPPPPAGVASVTVTLASNTINVTQTSQASAELRDAQNNVLTGRTVTWTSSNTAVATVSATSGLVTGVAAGTANVIATSEGRTGQAQITVAAPAAPPQITGLTITQNGQAANLMNVAGKLTLNFNVDVPAGFTGTLIVRVDTIEFARRPISAPYIVGSDVVAQPIVVGQTVDVETAQVNTIITAQAIRETGVLQNLDHILSVTVQPSVPGGQSGQQQTNIRTNNPVHAHGLYGFSGVTAVGTDGKTYTGDDGVGAVVFATYGTEVINGFEVILTDQQALYGHSTGGTLSVRHRITRTNLDKFTLPEVPISAPNLTYVLDKVTIGGVTYDPQVDFLGNSQYTTDLIGSGFTNTPQQVQGLTPPAGMTYVQLPQHLIEQIPGTVKGQWTIDYFNLDNEGPKQTSAATEPVFTFFDRQTSVGSAALSPTYGYGAFSGQLSATYNFAGGFRADRISDITSINASQTWYYAAPISDKANLYTPQYRIGQTFDLGESMGSRTYMGGVRVFDGRGNSSDFKLTTSVGNPWNIQGQLSSSFGVEEGAFGFTKTRANLNLSAMPLKSTWNQSTIDPSICWNYNVAGSVTGLPNGWLSFRAKFNGTYGFGAGAASDQYQIVNSTGGTSSGTATVFTAPLISQIFGKVGGASNQGLYEFEFNAADNAGQFIGDNNYPKKYDFLLDYTAPTNAGIALTGTVTAGQPASGTLSATDNWGISKGFLGMRFGYTCSLFAGNQVYVPIGELDIPTQNGAPVKSLSMPIMGTAPIGFWFFDPFSGVIDMSNFYRSNGVSWQVMDYARNRSQITFAPFGNTAPIPTITNVSSVKASMSSTNWCPGTCASGGQSIVDLTFNYFDPLSAGPPGLSKAEWFGIPSSGGGVVYRLGAATTLTSVVEGTGRRLSYNLQFDAKTYCGPPGPMQVFVVGYNTGYYLKVNPFFPVVIQSPTRYSNDCMKLEY